MFPASPEFIKISSITIIAPPSLCFVLCLSFYQIAGNHPVFKGNLFFLRGIFGGDYLEVLLSLLNFLTNSGSGDTIKPADYTIAKRCF